MELVLADEFARVRESVVRWALTARYWGIEVEVTLLRLILRPEWLGC